VAPARCIPRTVSATVGDAFGGGPAQVTSTPSAAPDRAATSAGSASHTLSTAPAARASWVRPVVPPATQTGKLASTSVRATSTIWARRSAAGATGMP
jgi:hypothetical protein